MSVWGIIPAAGNGTRIQPLAFSRELLPMAGEDRPKAVSEYLVERMEAGGATKLAFVTRLANRTSSNITASARARPPPSPMSSSPSPPAFAMRSSAQRRWCTKAKT